MGMSTDGQLRVRPMPTAGCAMSKVRRQSCHYLLMSYNPSIVSAETLKHDEAMIGLQYIANLRIQKRSRMYILGIYEPFSDVPKS